MHKPKISIVTPSYNQGIYLEETIQSVLNQNYPNLEYIVIDGGSNDSSCEVIKKYENQLDYWISEEDEGHGHALNKGFEKSTGEIMAWINSSDKYVPWTFQVVADIFATHPHVDWIMGRPSWWNCDGLMTNISNDLTTKNIYNFLLGDYKWIQQESVFWRKSLWEKSGAYIDQSYDFMVDGELWTRFFLHADIYVIDTVLGGYRLHSGARSADYTYECCAEMEKAISKMLKNASSTVQDYSNKFKNVKKYRAFCEENLLFKKIPIEKIFRRLIYAQEFAQVSHKFIRYYLPDQTWQEGTYPFTLM